MTAFPAFVCVYTNRYEATVLISIHSVHFPPFSVYTRGSCKSQRPIRMYKLKQTGSLNYSSIVVNRTGPYPANTSCWTDSGLMLGQLCRRWTNNKLRVMFSGQHLSFIVSNVGLMLAHRLRHWPNIQLALVSRVVFVKAVCWGSKLRRYVEAVCLGSMLRRYNEAVCWGSMLR